MSGNDDPPMQRKKRDPSWLGREQSRTFRWNCIVIRPPCPFLRSWDPSILCHSIRLLFFHAIVGPRTRSTSRMNLSHVYSPPSTCQVASSHVSDPPFPFGSFSSNRIRRWERSMLAPVGAHHQSIRSRARETDHEGSFPPRNECPPSSVAVGHLSPGDDRTSARKGGIGDRNEEGRT